MYIVIFVALKDLFKDLLYWYKDLFDVWSDVIYAFIAVVNYEID